MAVADNIYILSGEIHSGKTTAIINRIDGRNDVYGILSPEIEGVRFFEDAHTNKRFKMIADIDEPDVLQIGKYTFSKAAFDKASAILREGLKQPSGLLIVDEIGPLELQQQGFYEVLKEVVANDNQDLKKLLVVRQSLVDQVISFFKIINYTIVTTPLDI